MATLTIALAGTSHGDLKNITRVIEAHATSHSENRVSEGLTLTFSDATSPTSVAISYTDGSSGTKTTTVPIVGAIS